MTNHRYRYGSSIGLPTSVAAMYKHTLIQHHGVLGHADEKKKDKPKTIKQWEHDNIECDHIANDKAGDSTAPRPFFPLIGYTAMLKVGNHWVTTNFQDCVEHDVNTARQWWITSYADWILTLKLSI